MVEVKDPRFDKLVEIFQPKSQVKAFLEIYDIAGLVSGAHLGQGLGNEFLSNIQSVDGIFHMVRAFEDPDIVHVENDVNPVRDIEIIANELLQKDLQFVNAKLEENKKKAERFNDDEAVKNVVIFSKIKESLDSGKWIRHEEWTNAEIAQINKMMLFTTKPVIYLVNISKDDYVSKKNKWLKKIIEAVPKLCPGKIIPFSVEYEQSILNETHKDLSQLQKIIHTGNEVLNLLHFFTAGKDEVKSWTVRNGAKAPVAAGEIHSDMELGFICAEVMAYEDFIAYGSEAECKKEGKYKSNGKEYVVKDGDIMFFKFNKPQAKKK